jgi:periplasmic protein CpxP/Spy
MKKIILLLSLTIAMFTSYAQEIDLEDDIKKTPAERSEAVTKKLTEKLSLTADQQPKVKAIILERATKADEVRNKYNGNKEAAKAELKPIFKDANLKLQSVLTPEQFAKLKEVRKENKAKKQTKSGK